MERRLFGRTPLWIAAACGHLDTVNLLLENGQDPSGRDYPLVPVRHCSKWWYPAWARDECFSKAVEVAAEGGHIDVVGRLIKAWVNFGGYTSIHRGALEAAFFKGYEEIVELLLATDAPINPSTVQAAVYGGYENILNKLLDALQDEEAPGGLTAVSCGGSIALEEKILPRQHILPLALYAAALAGRLEIAQALLKQGANANAKTKGFHCTALAAASANGHLDMVQFLIQHGARVNEVLPPDELAGKRRRNRFMLPDDSEKSGRHGSAIQAAAFAGYLEAVRFLLDAGADVNAPGGYFGPAIQAATTTGELEIVWFMIENGAYLNTVAGCYGTCLQSAAFHGHVEILKLLIQAGAKVNQEGGEFGYPLVGGGASRNVEALKTLVAAGARVDVVTASVGSALTATIAASADISFAFYKPVIPWRPSLTAELGDFAQLTENPRSLLPSQGMRYVGGPHIFGKYAEAAAREVFVGSQKPFISEVNSDLPDQLCQMTACIEVLLSHGADPNIRSGPWGTPLLAAIGTRSLPAVKTLIAAEADIFATRSSPEQSSRLLGNMSSEYGHYEITETCLISAVEENYFLGENTASEQLEICQLLLDQGADPNERSLPDGLTLLHICRSQEVTRLLLERGPW